MEIYHFPTAGGMHAYAFLSETKKHPLKIPKISPKNLGRFAKIIGGMNNYLLRASRACFDLSYVWKIQKYFLLFFVQKHLCNSFSKSTIFHPQFLSAYIFFTSNIEYITFEWREIFLTAVINKYVIINCVFFLFSTGAVGAICLEPNPSFSKNG